MAFPTSPGINTSEIDATTSIPAVSVSTGAYAGRFNWGPVMSIMPISSENQLAATFGEPDNNNAAGFLSVSSFLAYSSDVRIVRQQATGMFNAIGNGATPIEIDNANYYFNNYYQNQVANTGFCARYPGAIGNSLQVVVFANGAAWTANAGNTSDPLYSIANHFNWAPNTTPYVSSVTNGGVTGDEVHVAVVDEGGLFTGVANTVLEVYQGLSRLSDALNPTGQSNYYKEVIWRQSQYVYAIGVPSANIQGWGATIASGPTFVNDIAANVNSFLGGSDGTATSANTINAYNMFADSTFVDISLVFTGPHSATVVNSVIDNVVEVRGDCVAFVSPSLVATQDSTSPIAAITAYYNTISRSSYVVADSGWKYMYNKYQDQYVWVPLNADVAGLCARTDNSRDPWWSPAGLQRGVIKNVVKLAYNPGKSDRDTLYKAGIDPVVSFPGQGTMLYGDKTFLNYSSAFDHINVRRLFIVLEKTISKAAQSSLFEFNDTFTRAQFVALITPFLRTVQGRRGITAFQVVCDGSNNPGSVVDANQFVGDIYIQPARSINYIQLNFVAVGTGVNFNTIIGQVV